MVEVMTSYGKYVKAPPKKPDSLHAEWAGKIIKLLGSNTTPDVEAPDTYPLNVKYIQEILEDGSIRARILEVIKH